MFDMSASKIPAEILTYAERQIQPGRPWNKTTGMIIPFTRTKVPTAIKHFWIRLWIVG